MLESLGVRPEQERVYRELIATFDTDPVVLAARVGFSPEEVRRCLDGLHAAGLIRRGPGGELDYIPVPPDVGLGRLLVREQDALENARRAVSALTERYHASARRRDAAQLVEVVTGRGALREQLRALQLGAGREVVWFCKAGHVAMPSSDNTEEFTALGRGVRFRVLYEQALLEEPGMLDGIAESVAAGERARTVPSLPIRLAIADRALGLCPLVPLADSDGEPTAALFRESTVLSALVALFESYWERGSPLFAGETSSSPITGDEHQLLSMLVAGVTDKAIASRLSISQRTVQRRVAELLRRAGAQTRAQLAWQAARLGWLD